MVIIFNGHGRLAGWQDRLFSAVCEVQMLYLEFRLR